MYTVYCVYAFCAADAKRYVCRVYTASIIRAPARMGLNAYCGVGALAEKKQEREKGKKVNKQTSQKNPPAARQASIQRVLALLQKQQQQKLACLPARVPIDWFSASCFSSFSSSSITILCDTGVFIHTYIRAHCVQIPHPRISRVTSRQPPTLSSARFDADACVRVISLQPAPTPCTPVLQLTVDRPTDAFRFLLASCCPGVS